MAKYTPPSGREFAPTGPNGCIGGVHSPGEMATKNTEAAPSGSQPVTRDQGKSTAPPRK